jgi:hypothetical protein
VTKEHLSPDVLELLGLLDVHGARVVLVGGEAVTYHGYARFTGDVDLFYDRTPAGARGLWGALQSFWGGAVPLVARPEDLEEEGLVLQYGRSPNRVDLLSSLVAVTFEEAWATRVEDVVHVPEGPVRLAILSRELLIRNKRAAGRPKDLDDAEHLEAQARRG